MTTLDLIYARPPAYYAEDHCALNWRFVSAGLLAPVVVIAAAVAGITLGGAAFWALFGVLGLGMMTWIAFGQMLPYAWPLGIRLDSDGLRVSGVRWAEQHPGRARRKATVPRQYSQVFACRRGTTTRPNCPCRWPTAGLSALHNSAHAVRPPADAACAAARRGSRRGA